MQPDYMVLVQEPDTEATNSGQASAETPSGSVSLLSQMIAAVGPSGATGIKLGAGVGTWQAGAQGYIQGYVSQPIDFVDVHIYEVNLLNLPNAIAIAGIASAAGLPLSMSECWLFKSSDTELGALSRIQLRSREVFSFWGPLDAQFLHTMEVFGGSTRMAFMNPFVSYCFFAYLDYSKTLAATPPDELMDMQHKASNLANKDAAFSSTGIAYYQSIVSPPDTAPPSVPAGVGAVSRAPTTSLVNWTASTDNIGVAGYKVSRNGSPIGNTAYTFFEDAGLSEATTYTYTVQAFDLAENISPASLPANVTTKNLMPPTAPKKVTGKAVASDRIVLNWKPSSDIEGVNSYLIFRGNTPVSLTQFLVILSPKTTCNSGRLTPGTTYYYGVEAKDISGNVSPMSTIISVTTPALPSAPGNLKAKATASDKIGLSWSPSNGSLPIVYTYVYRGTSPNKLVQRAILNGAKTTFEDTTVEPATTYYYAVQAADTDHDRSHRSAVAKAVTP
jgi:chitodextrinase